MPKQNETWSAGDEMTSAKLNNTGFVSFGGDGSDGALAISSGTTTIDLSSSAIVVLNYTSISITGTADLAFSNPHANGTIIIIKSQGAVTITSSTNPAIDLRSLGGTAGAVRTAGTNGNGLMNGPEGGGAGTTDGRIGSDGIRIVTPTVCTKFIPLFCGGGGAGGYYSAGSEGAGGRGAGALFLECNGALSISSTINASGIVGVDGTVVGGNNDGCSGGGGASLNDTASDTYRGAGVTSTGGGGGGGGVIVIIYNTLTSNTGTYSVAGGAGGNGGIIGGAGSVGYSLVAINTEFI